MGRSERAGIEILDPSGCHVWSSGRASRSPEQIRQQTPALFLLSPLCPLVPRFFPSSRLVCLSCACLQQSHSARLIRVSRDATLQRQHSIVTGGGQRSREARHRAGWEHEGDSRVGAELVYFQWWRHVDSLLWVGLQLSRWRHLEFAPLHPPQRHTRTAISLRLPLDVLLAVRAGCSLTAG